MVRPRGSRVAERVISSPVRVPELVVAVLAHRLKDVRRYLRESHDAHLRFRKRTFAVERDAAQGWAVLWFSPADVKISHSDQLGCAESSPPLVSMLLIVFDTHAAR